MHWGFSNKPVEGNFRIQSSSSVTYPVSMVQLCMVMTGKQLSQRIANISDNIRISKCIGKQGYRLGSAQKQLQGLQFSFVTNIKEINLSCYEFKFVQPNPSGTSYESSLSTASLGLEQKQHITLWLLISKKHMTGYLSKTSSKLLWKKSSAFKHVRKLAVFQKYTS